jgi:uncharacterized protein DUF3616
VARLEFDPKRLTVGDDTDIRQGLSAVVLHEANVWLACDEGCRLERLSQSDTFGLSLAAQAVFPLADLLALPATSDEEADIEELDIDDGWLWLVGSHSVKRKRPKNDEPSEAAAVLVKTERNGNRHLLARIPLEGTCPSATRARGDQDRSQPRQNRVRCLRPSSSTTIRTWHRLSTSPAKTTGLTSRGSPYTACAPSSGCAALCCESGAAAWNSDSMPTSTGAATRAARRHPPYRKHLCYLLPVLAGGLVSSRVVTPEQNMSP